MLREKKQPEQKPALPAEFNQVIEVLPEPDTDGTYFWQPFAERVWRRFEGAPGMEGAGSFVDELLRAGASAVPVVRRNRLWRQGAPDISEKRARGVYELRIRLGLFFAASLRYLVQGASRLRVRCGEAEWHVVSEEGQSFRDFAAAQEGDVEVTWTNSAPGYGDTCLTIQMFFTPGEALLLTPELAREVYDHVGPDGPRGLFGIMLAREGLVEKAAVDVARVFLEALGEAVDQKVVGVNMAVNGHVFITPSFWFVTSPIGVGEVLRWLGRRRHGRRYNFSRRQVMEALASADCLMGVDAGSGRAVRVCDIDFSGVGLGNPLALNGLAVKAEKVPGIPAAEPYPEWAFALRTA